VAGTSSSIKWLSSASPAARTPSGTPPRIAKADSKRSMPTTAPGSGSPVHRTAASPASRNRTRHVNPPSAEGAIENNPLGEPIT
jgi:hypothetical protein